LRREPSGFRAKSGGANPNDGQGEIRTLDTGFTGMPVFETGAFNHSATCPAALQVIVASHLLQPGAVALTMPLCAVSVSDLGQA
jgi:hypothetical protein